MDKTLVSILDTEGPVSLELSNKTFSNENIEEFFDCASFYQVNFIDCSFNECEFLGNEFEYCFFKKCKFTDTTIRKSNIADCKSSILKNVRTKSVRQPFKCAIVTPLSIYKASI